MHNFQHSYRAVSVLAHWKYYNLSLWIDLVYQVYWAYTAKNTDTYAFCTMQKQLSFLENLYKSKQLISYNYTSDQAHFLVL